MNVYAYNREQFIDLGINDDNIMFSPDYYVSILPTGGPKGDPIFHKNHRNCITLVFDDVLEGGKFWGKDINDFYTATPINESQARELYEFLEKIPDFANVHVHCVYGKSRTGAVCRYLQDYKNATVYNVDVNHVNKRVYSLLENIHDRQALHR